MCIVATRPSMPRKIRSGGHRIVAKNIKDDIVKVMKYGAAAVVGGYGLSRIISSLAERWVDRVVATITQDPYEENWFEAISQFIRVGVQEVIETDLRAHSEGLLLRPLGSPKKMPSFDRLSFHFAQLKPLPTAHDRLVNTKVIIGPQARRPLTVDLPILMGGMGYGVSLSKEAKIAIARATSRVGTAANTGEGPFLTEERQAARRLIVQYHRGNWMDPNILVYADAVEIHIGQGADGAAGGQLPPEKVNEKLLAEMNLAHGEEAVLLSTFPEVGEEDGLVRLVDRARHLSRGAPVIGKIGASHRLENDLSILYRAGVDGVLVDGAQAGSGQSAPIAQDDFGIPTIYALVRARRHLDRIDEKRSVSLIVSGGIFTPGDVLKCLALGADAVSMATAPMLALMAGQQQTSTPGEPPTQVITYQGNNQKEFQSEKATDSLTRFFHSCRLELDHAVRQLGKDDVRAVDRTDLCALDDQTAKIVGVDVAYAAPDEQPVFSR